MRRARTLSLAAAALGLALALQGCASSAYHQGVKEGRKGNWDLAVARLTKALQKDPDNIKYRIALETARVEASRQHLAAGRKLVAEDHLEKAADELEIAVKYDTSNQSAADELRALRRRLERLREEKRRTSEYEAARARVEAARLPVPVLSPRSPVPIRVKFVDQPLEKIFEALGKLAGVNVVFDEGYRDRRGSLDVQGVTFEQALDQLTFTNRLFYKVLDQNTVIIVPESQQKRRQYDDNLVRTFYLQNADVNETVQLVTKLAKIQTVAGNPALGAITIIGTPDQLALAERIIDANDKAKGEVVVEVEILEVSRTDIKKYGIELSNYQASVTFSPTGAANEVQNGFTSLRAQFLSSLNLSDFIVNIPSNLLTNFLQTDSNVKILAAPRLRAAEGKKTSLKIGTEVPIPVTTFTATQAGTSTFAPATSFQYRNVGLTLELTPKVSANGEISLELNTEFSSLGDDRNVGTGSNPLIVPTFLTRNVTGVLRLRDGETSLLGGLIQSRDSDSLKGALGLQSIPILNKIFTSRQHQVDENEILISITPHLVSAPQITEEDLKSLYIGTAERPDVPGARPPLFGEPEPSPTPSPALGPPGTQQGVPEAPPSPAPSAVSLATAGATPAASPPAPNPQADGTAAGGAAPTTTAGGAPASSGAPGASAPAAAAKSASVPTALLRPSELNLRVGEEDTLELVVLGVSDLRSVEGAISFEPALAEAVDVAPGTLLTYDGGQVSVDRSLETGHARFRFTRAAPILGSGPVASLKLRGLRPGTAALGVISLTLHTGTGQETLSVAPARLVVQP
jgi:general secretion pathway protein D